jgi:hypothetical protein
MSGFITIMLTLMFPWSLAHVAGKIKTYTCSHGVLQAVVVPVGKKGFEDQESRVEIRSADGRRVRRKSFSSSDGEHGWGVNHAAWSGDGQFFISISLAQAATSRGVYPSTSTPVARTGSTNLTASSGQLHQISFWREETQ